jgi:hypothetical protein
MMAHLIFVAPYMALESLVRKARQFRSEVMVNRTLRKYLEVAEEDGVCDEWLV